MPMVEKNTFETLLANGVIFFDDSAGNGDGKKRALGDDACIIYVLCLSN